VPDCYVGGGSHAESHCADHGISIVWAIVKSHLGDGAFVGETVVHVD